MEPTEAGGNPLWAPGRTPCACPPEARTPMRGPFCPVCRPPAYQRRIVVVGPSVQSAEPDPPRVVMAGTGLDEPASVDLEVRNDGPVAVSLELRVPENLQDWLTVNDGSRCAITVADSAPASVRVAADLRKTTDLAAGAPVAARLEIAWPASLVRSGFEPDTIELTVALETPEIRLVGHDDTTVDDRQAVHLPSGRGEGAFGVENAANVMAEGQIEPSPDLEFDPTGFRIARGESRVVRVAVRDFLDRPAGTTPLPFEIVLGRRIPFAGQIVVRREQVEEGRPVGIDFGTTNSSVCYLDGPVVRAVEIAQGKFRETFAPSVVALSERDPEEYRIGRHAEGLYVEGWRVIANAKRYLPDGAQWRVGGRVCGPVEVGAKLVRRLLASAAATLHLRGIQSAVITHPASWTQSQKAATERIGLEAGLAEVTLWPEPVAAAYSFAYDREVERGRYVIYDWGGGTFDAVLIDIDPDKPGGKRCGMAAKADGGPLPPAGNPRLGGVDIDRHLASQVLAQINEQTHAGVRFEQLEAAAQAYDGPEAPSEEARPWALTYARLMALAENVKKRIYQPEPSSTVNVDLEPFPVLRGAAAVGSVLVTVNRQRLDAECVQPMVRQTVSLVEGLLREAGMRPEEIAQIVLVGGSSQIPGVEALLRRVTPNVTAHPSPRLAISQGAAYLSDPTFAMGGPTVRSAYPYGIVDDRGFVRVFCPAGFEVGQDYPQEMELPGTRSVRVVVVEATHKAPAEAEPFDEARHAIVWEGRLRIPRRFWGTRGRVCLRGDRQKGVLVILRYGRDGRGEEQEIVVDERVPTEWLPEPEEQEG